MWVMMMGESDAVFLGYGDVLQEATSPVFTQDGQYLLYVDRGCTVIAYSLCDLAPRYHVPDCSAHRLLALPVHHHLFLATRFDVDDNCQKTATVSVADLCSRYSQEINQSFIRLNKR